MQVEDQLTLEAAKYNEIIKTRVRQLQDKIDEQHTKISCLYKESEVSKTSLKEQTNLVKALQLDIKIANKDIKIKEEKLTEMKKEVNDLQKIKVDKIESIKKL
jgi:hypothetical protein